MSIDFDGVGDFLQITTSAVISGMPFSMACWFRADDTIARCFMMAIYDISGGFNQHSLILGGTIGGDPVQAESQNFLTVFPANTTSGYSTTGWQHAAGVWTNTTDRASFLNGAYKGTDTNSVPDPGATLDSFTIGATGLGTLPMFGLIAHASIWNIALSDAEVFQLAAGVHPMSVRRGNLIFYLPMTTASAPQVDLVGGRTLTINGNPTTSLSEPPVNPLPEGSTDRSPAVHIQRVERRVAVM